MPAQETPEGTRKGGEGTPKSSTISSHRYQNPARNSPGETLWSAPRKQDKNPGPEPRRRAARQRKPTAMEAQFATEPQRHEAATRGERAKAQPNWTKATGDKARAERKRRLFFIISPSLKPPEPTSGAEEFPRQLYYTLKLYTKTSF